jgi:hypothetical protein
MWTVPFTSRKQRRTQTMSDVGTILFTFGKHRWFVSVGIAISDVGTVPFASRILRRFVFIGVSISKMGCEQFPLPLEYIDGHKPSVFPSVMCILNDGLCLYSLYILLANTYIEICTHNTIIGVHITIIK